MPRVYIGVGSNIDPEGNILAALRLLREVAPLVRVSMFYRTEADGSPGSAEFVNGVVAVETEMPPRQLKFGVLRRIEESLGRVRGPDKCASRTIDLDIAVYGSEVIREPDLVVPDPHVTDRAFLALPILELDPGLELPSLCVTLADAARKLDAGDMVALDEFTNMLRRELCP